MTKKFEFETHYAYFLFRTLSSDIKLVVLKSLSLLNTRVSDKDSLWLPLLNRWLPPDNSPSKAKQTVGIHALSGNINCARTFDHEHSTKRMEIKRNNWINIGRFRFSRSVPASWASAASAMPIIPTPPRRCCWWVAFAFELTVVDYLGANAIIFQWIIRLAWPMRRGAEKLQFLPYKFRQRKKKKKFRNRNFIASNGSSCAELLAGIIFQFENSNLVERGQFGGWVWRVLLVFNEDLQSQ